ncbi:MAG: PQQ-binding-like beta-propeller repeat protein [Spirochaetota bacterium]|nr:MAG: PQQ-binding-like beta-propeller repeat protein [Spirochaetota bacterium]
MRPKVSFALPVASKMKPIKSCFDKECDTVIITTVMKTRFIILCIITLLFPALCFAVTQENWPTYMGNQYLTGNNDGIIPESEGIIWSFAAPAKLFNPVSVNGRVFVVSMDSYLYCLDASNGEFIWKFKAEGPLTRMVCVYKGRVYLPAGRYLYCLDEKSGEVIWGRRDPQFGFYGTPTISKGRLFYGNRKGFYARELRNGHLVWENFKIYTYGGFPSYWNGMVYTVSKEFQKEVARLIALNENDGSVVWSSDIENVPNIFSPVVYDEKIYLALGEKLSVFDAETGEPLFESILGQRVSSSTVFSNGRIFLSLMDGRILKIDPSNGHYELLFSAPFGTQFAIVGSYLFVPLKGEKGGLGIIDSNTGDVKQKIYIDEGEPATLTISKGVIFLPTSSTLYALGEGSLIASVKPEKPFAPELETKTIKGELKDRDSGMPLKGKVESLTKLDSGEIIQKEEDVRDGGFEIEVPKEGKTDLVFSSPGYTFQTITLASEEAIDDLSAEPLELTLPKAKAGEKLVVESIHFKTGSANLEPNSLAALNRLFQMMQENPHIKIEIGGHTDSTGSKEVNQELSLLRAEAAASWLIRNGILSKRIKTAGYGDTMPIADNATEEGRRKNRRTEITIIDD